MKALSVYPIWAAMIRDGRKTIEVRKWRTHYRGPLLICATRKPLVADINLPAGVAVCVADLVDCRPMTANDAEAACVGFAEDLFAFILNDVRVVEPFAVVGQQRFFNVTLPPALSRSRRTA